LPRIDSALAVQTNGFGSSCPRAQVSGDGLDEVVDAAEDGSADHPGDDVGELASPFLDVIYDALGMSPSGGREGRSSLRLGPAC